MDNPERNQIRTPISEFEDSHVFNYINSLSPIKPVKSTHIAQTFNALSFASLPSVFTLPHVSSQKESRFLRRHYFSDLSNPEFSSDIGNEGNRSAGVLDAIQVSDCSADPQESFDPGISITEVSVDPPNDSSKLAIELPRTLKYDCGSPDSNQTLELQGICQFEQAKEGTGCDWENLVSDGAALLIFASSTDVEASEVHDQKLVDPETSPFTSLLSKLPQYKIDDMQKIQLVGQIDCCEQHEAEVPATQPRELGEQKETDHTPQILSSTFHNKEEVNDPGERMDDKSTFHNKEEVNDPGERMDDKAGNHIPFGYKPDTQQQRGMRRRCLVFEMAGAHKNNLEDDSNTSSISSQSDRKFSSDDKQLVPIKPGICSSPCVLPGIGLHLNALAATTKECRVVKHETLASGRQLISMPSSISSFHFLTSEQKPLNECLTQNSTDKEMGLAVSGVQVMQDACRSAFGVSEDFDQSSLKKKRRRLEHAGESEACKRCNCKKSKCLKLYCECFAAGMYCVEPCSCLECFNKPVHEDTVLATRKQIESRNPLAFAPKVIRNSESVPEIGEESNKTPASARHKRGCNCKKSSCLKKYCECYQGGVGCSITCRCEGCKNAFGRKDESTPVGTEEAQPEGEEAETCEKNGEDKQLPNNKIESAEEQYSDHVLPLTPFQICRPLVQLLFSSSGKPLQSSLLSVGSSPRLQTSQTLEKSDSLQPHPKFEKHFQIIPEDETPEILRGNFSSTSGVKIASPNCKRVSPPHSEFGLSPGRRISRKLVLQSVPSLPSLPPNQETSNFSVKFK